MQLSTTTSGSAQVSGIMHGVARHTSPWLQATVTSCGSEVTLFNNISNPEDPTGAEPNNFCFHRLGIPTSARICH